eukprot:gnl/TRDRNA2_/TRDRNA2_71245_c1_seq1.p1 gnl/TRDRNA2_/TRDRNA2_71245_c1~~gnl/TRDRNA2_/TRDRNA2_71245_c1_seq1.p1  ORF type:complete len:418 (+),score=71.63 gnl/TRDRNA2_/TRDRNA2_71245_c1_seq1:122-1255(+)
MEAPADPREASEDTERCRAPVAARRNSRGELVSGLLRMLRWYRALSQGSRFGHTMSRDGLVVEPRDCLRDVQAVARTCDIMACLAKEGCLDAGDAAVVWQAAVGTLNHYQGRMPDLSLGEGAFLLSGLLSVRRVTAAALPGCPAAALSADGAVLATWIAEQLEEAEEPKGSMRFRLASPSKITYHAGQAAMALAQHACTSSEEGKQHVSMLTSTLPYYRVHLDKLGTPSVAYANWQTQAARALADAVPSGDPLRLRCAEYVVALSAGIVADFAKGRAKLRDGILSNASSLECIADAAATCVGAGKPLPGRFSGACTSAAKMLLNAQDKHVTGGFGFSLAATCGDEAIQRIDTTGHVANAFVKLLTLEPPLLEQLLDG